MRDSAIWHKRRSCLISAQNAPECRVMRESAERIGVWCLTQGSEYEYRKPLAHPLWSMRIERQPGPSGPVQVEPMQIAMTDRLHLGTKRRRISEGRSPRMKTNAAVGLPERSTTRSPVWAGRTDLLHPSRHGPRASPAPEDVAHRMRIAVQSRRCDNKRHKDEDE